MKEIKNLSSLKWLVFGMAMVPTLIIGLFMAWELDVAPWLAIVNFVIVIATILLVLDFTFRAIVKRERKLKDTMKELFSSYQYIGNANRQIDMLTNFSKIVTKADFTENETISFVVNTAGRLAEADFCTVILWDEDKKRYRKSKVYYHTDKALFESVLSHLKCEMCESHISTNEFILEINKNSEKKCKNFPEVFWDTYSMICFPIVVKGKKKGFVNIIHNNKTEISHLNFKLISSLATQLGTVLK
ncbi:GAF domain-containing protein [Patescibacteria group bacterium]|nr:GAF domain-containing protein [Patescibacteria group bacterium]MBU1673052.1 GAF domain-containing protein [Patescibacteria group bacterium]MBU1963658.1 GAF domain-containing protein [Patescibacteria group bacterium]